MRYLFLLFSLLSTMFISFGQEHMSFKGVEMNCSASVFYSKMNASGFNLLYEKEGSYVMKGKFAGENATIVFKNSEVTNQVGAVVVFFEEKSSWASLKAQYLLFKKNLAEKYVMGLSDEYFDSPYYEGDGFEMSAVKLGKCHYDTKFEDKRGFIILSISEDGEVSILYIDKIMWNKENDNDQKQRMNDL